MERNQNGSTDNSSNQNKGEHSENIPEPTPPPTRMIKNSQDISGSNEKITDVDLNDWIFLKQIKIPLLALG